MDDFCLAGTRAGFCSCLIAVSTCSKSVIIVGWSTRTLCFIVAVAVLTRGSTVPAVTTGAASMMSGFELISITAMMSWLLVASAAHTTFC